MNKEVISFNLKPTDRMEVYKMIYRCPDDEFIPIGWRRPHDNKVCYHSIIRRADMEEWVPKITSEGTLYQSFATLGAEALRGREGPKSYDTYLKAIEKGKTEYYEAKKAHAKSMAALCVDCDVGRENLYEAQWHCMFNLPRMVGSGELLCPSLVAFSGRGFYLIFLLKDELQSDRAPAADGPNPELYKKCYRKLEERLKEYSPDPSKASHFSSWFKAADTIDTNTGRTVGYYPIYYRRNGDEAMRVYTLQEMAAALNSPPTEDEVFPVAIDIPNGRLSKVPESIRENRKKRRSTSCRGSEPYRARRDEIEKICHHRGYNLSGHRELTLWHYFNNSKIFYKMIGLPQPDHRDSAFKDTKKLNDSFKPVPLPDSELLDACKDIRYRVTNDAIAAAMDVSSSEVQALGLKTIIPAVEAQRRKAEALKQKAQKAERSIKIEKEILKDTSNEEIMAMYGISRATLYRCKKKLGMSKS